MQALGCHVFAGGFTQGVRRVMKCDEQLEIHNFGRETCEAIGIKFTNCSDWHEWPDRRPDLLFGNPRCTGFSTITSGYGDNINGPNATCTKDIYDLCNYGIKQDIPIVIWESVTQAYTTGRLLVDAVEAQFLRAGYRVAHLFVCAGTHGNCQPRKRYFFVGYKTKSFNIMVPEEPPTIASLRSKIEHLEEHVSYFREMDKYNRQYYDMFGEGWTLTDVVRTNIEFFREHCPKLAKQYDNRKSDLPFSIHQPLRLTYDRHCPTLSSSCAQYIHPKLNRTLTVKECATIMGWENEPLGNQPYAQIAKGVCPEVGTWLAEQAILSLKDNWGGEDFESSYLQGESYGGDSKDKRVKTFDYRNYYKEIA